MSAELQRLAQYRKKVAGNALDAEAYYDKAIADFTEAIRLSPGDEFTFLHRGIAARQFQRSFLMADGVPPDKVYEVLSQPGGVERAIKKIKELKPHVAVWWASGAQHAQLMKDGEVDMITGWNGRFDVVAKDGGKVAYTFNQALLDYDCYAILAPTPR